MKNYVLASHDLGSNRVHYLTAIAGEYTFGEVDECLRFDLDEILELLKNHNDLSYLGFSVVRIEDCTFEIFKENKELVYKYSLLEYAIR